jgi:hypothetical protein
VTRRRRSIEPLGSIKVVNFLTSWVTITFSRKSAFWSWLVFWRILLWNKLDQMLEWICMGSGRDCCLCWVW